MAIYVDLSADDIHGVPTKKRKGCWSAEPGSHSHTESTGSDTPNTACPRCTHIGQRCSISRAGSRAAGFVARFGVDGADFTPFFFLGCASFELLCACLLASVAMPKRCGSDDAGIGGRRQLACH